MSATLTDVTTKVEETSFKQYLDGQFIGILRWHQLDALWETIQANDSGWYFYQVGSPVPDTPLHGKPLADAIAELDTLLRQEHDYDYCGIVYADNTEQPSLVKVYDPNSLGSSCGCGGVRIPPRWIISKIPPETIEDNAPTPNNRRRWWKRLSLRN